MEVYPKVLDVFKIIIDFVHDVLNKHIYLSDVVYIKLLWVTYFVFAVLLVLRLLTLNTQLRMGYDTGQSYAKPQRKFEYQRLRINRSSQRQINGSTKHGVMK